MMRDSFVFYRSFIEGLEDVDDSTFRRLIEAVTRYALDDEETQLTGLEKGIYTSWKANIDASNRRRDNGKLGGRPPKEKTYGYEDKNHRLEDAEPNKNVNVNDNANVNDKEKDKKKVVRFAPPSVEEVKAYCDDRHNGIDPESFIDFYSSKGWKVGNQPMKDWQAAIRTWERRHNEKRPEKPVNNPKVHFENERTYDFEAIEKKLLAKQRRVDSG